MKADADYHKSLGNKYFADSRFEDAIREYTNAIIKFPQEPAYFTNRALCYLKLGINYDSVISDCEKAIALAPDAYKAYYYSGSALMEQKRFESAINALQQAYKLALETDSVGSRLLMEMGSKILLTKKRRWQEKERLKRENENELYLYLRNLINSDKDKRIAELRTANIPTEDIQVQQAYYDDRLAILDTLFHQVEVMNASPPTASMQPRHVPDAFFGKISFEIMTDPVVTNSGITYDRAELRDHLKTIGKFDPLTRQPLEEKDLIPNLALKEVINDFLSLNGWAVDY